MAVREATSLGNWARLYRSRSARQHGRVSIT